MLRPSSIDRPHSVRRQRPCCAQRLVALLLLATASLGGCSRAHYHRQADREVSQIVTQKNQPGRWGIPGFRLQYDPRSRYFDPTNPDRPPMPPDDPSSHVFMHCVDGKHGALTYHRDGDLAELPNPSWREQLAFYTDMKPDGTVHLNREGAVQLALVHSPAYFQQLEELYLSALDVSTERWRFDAQFFGGIDPLLYTHRSKNAPNGGTVDQLADVNTLRMEKQFAAGGELIVGLANSIVWQFAGTNSNTNVSLLNFSFIQPLLRGGGRRFILEQLTIVERAMLANLRAFERYRQGFYTNVVIGDGGTPGPSRRGGFFGGTGLTGFSGQGSGGFGEVGGATGFGGRNNNNTGGGGGAGSGFAGGGAGTVGGYIGILQLQQQILNTDQNFTAQKRELDKLRDFQQHGQLTLVQLLQFEQNIGSIEANLLQSKTSLTNSVETFQRSTLGLPPNLSMSFDNSMIQQFQLIVPETNQLYEKIETMVDGLGKVPVEPGVGLVTAALNEFEALHVETKMLLDQVGDDLKKVEAKRAERLRTIPRKNLDNHKKHLEDYIKRVDETNADYKLVNEADFSKALESVKEIRANFTPQTQAATLQRIVTNGRELAKLVRNASLIQVRARVDLVTLNPIVLDEELALEIARANRYDWMNNRAALVDTWRLIAFNARALMSSVNLVFDGSLNTRGDNPVKFQSSTGTMRAGVEFDAPFTRLLERNNYRSVLIDYQRDRRQLIQYEDSVNQTLRQSLRNLRQLEENLEIQRQAVDIAVRRVDQTRLTLDKPPVPGQPVELGPTVAFDLLTAMNDLQNTQNNFMSVWLNHYATRMVLMRELGLMELDENGLWIDRPLDEVVSTADRQQAEELPPDVPVELLEALGIEPPASAQGSAGPELPAPQDAGEELAPLESAPPSAKSNRREF